MEKCSRGCSERLYDVLGIVIVSGYQNFKRLNLHWSLESHYDYPKLRECMPRDFFLLLSRNFGCAAPNGPKRGQSSYDSKYNTRQALDIVFDP